MYLKRISEAFTGYVRFKAEGYYIERFINNCRAKGFYLEKLKRIKDTIIEANVPAKDYREICKIAKKNKCRIKIFQKKGITFVLKRYRKRKIFLIALAIICIFLFISSKFVWNIEVRGDISFPKNEILDIANSEGLCVGKLKKDINTKRIIDEIRTCRSDISWVRNKDYWN